MAIKSTLFEFWRKVEVGRGERLTVSEVARAAGVSRSAIQRLLDGETSRFDGPTIDAICAYFGVPDGPIPFLAYEVDKPE